MALSPHPDHKRNSTIEAEAPAQWWDICLAYASTWTQFPTFKEISFSTE